MNKKAKNDVADEIRSKVTEVMDFCHDKGYAVVFGAYNGKTGNSLTGVQGDGLSCLNVCAMAMAQLSNQCKVPVEVMVSHVGALALEKEVGYGKS